MSVKRECGDCTLCCKLLAIPELGKRKDVWCPNCDQSGNKCMVYETRPDSCRAFDCLWLHGYGGEELWPRKSHIVMGTTINEECNLVLYVDKFYKDAWRKEPWDSFINSFLKKTGKKVFIVCGDKRTVLFGTHQETP